MAGSKTGGDGTGVGKDTKVTKDPTRLLADTREAGQDAIDAVLNLILEVEHRLPLVYPRIDVASVLTISRHHTEGSAVECSYPNLGLSPDSRNRARTGWGIF